MATPHRTQSAFLYVTSVNALAEESNVEYHSKALLEKKREGQLKRTKNCGQARLLTAEDMLKKQAEEQIQLSQAMAEKDRNKGLKRKVGFAKLVWREFKFAVDIFE